MQGVQISRQYRQALYKLFDVRGKRHPASKHHQQGLATFLNIYLTRIFFSLALRTSYAFSRHWSAVQSSPRAMSLSVIRYMFQYFTLILSTSLRGILVIANLSAEMFVVSGTQQPVFSVFSHTARLSEFVPANQALCCHVT